MSKKCSMCGIEKELTSFSRHINCKGGYRPECKACRSSIVKKYRDNNKDKLRSNKLLKTYGISKEEYNRLLDSQKGVCAICYRKCFTGKRLAVDHDHITGKVRGLLCSKCNPALGYLDDSILILKSAISYLEAHNGKQSQRAIS